MYNVNKLVVIIYNNILRFEKLSETHIQMLMFQTRKLSMRRKFLGIKKKIKEQVKLVSRAIHKDQCAF
jgi:hypothetical protein